MTTIQITYKDYLKNGLIPDAKASILRVLTHSPDQSVQAETDCHNEWDPKSPEDKEIYENEIFGTLSDEILEGEQQQWLDVFGTEVQFMLAPVSTETLAQKCRKREPQI